MKQSYRKISSFLTAIVVLLSTMSFTIDMHYCGDTLVDAAIFEKIGILRVYNLSELSRQFNQETGDTMNKYKEKRE